MKRKVIFAMLVLVISSLANLTASAQGVIVYKTDGTKIKVPYTQLDSIATYTYEEGQDETEDNAEVKEYMVGNVSFKMIRVQAGTFRMGSTSGQTGEQPVHSVTLSSDYYIGETEVTQELWTAVMGTNPSRFTSDSRLPVEKVSWTDCQTFITKLNSLTGAKFRLPTEAEWEFAARGGNISKGYTYSGSNTEEDVAWCGSNSGDKTHVVKTKLPNELGIYDMSGNVFEWCNDWYDSYSSAAVTDPQGPSSESNRVVRGGDFCCMVLFCRCTSRHKLTPSTSFDSVGLRLVSQ
jgi:formylglycine-generating enzyme required for sulfatase activity